MKPLLFISSIVVLFSSCGIHSKWVAPPYTNVEKIMTLKPGMTVEEVTGTLGIPAYNVYNIQEDGSMILLYNYRIKNRKMEVPVDPAEQNDVIHSESGQDGGQTFYQTESNYLYVYFKEKKLKSVITEAGLVNSEFIMLVNNNLKIISKEDMSKLTMKKVGDYYIVNSADSSSTIVVSAANVVQNSKSQSTVENPDRKKSQNAKTTRITGAILLGLLMIPIIRFLAN